MISNGNEILLSEKCARVVPMPTLRKKNFKGILFKDKKVLQTCHIIYTDRLKGWVSMVTRRTAQLPKYQANLTTTCEWSSGFLQYNAGRGGHT